VRSPIMRSAHPWSSQALFELLDPTFNGPRTNGIAIAAPFMILHSPLVRVEIGGMVSQIMLLQISHNAPNPPHEKMLTHLLIPGLGLFFVVGIAGGRRLREKYGIDPGDEA
jgi:hypothetical protein